MISLNSAEAMAVLKPLTFFVIGVVLYSLFIFKFYRFVARRDVFKLDLNKYNNVEHSLLKKSVRAFFYMIKYVIFFPICVFFWFIVLTGLLAFLARDQTIQNILLVSMALVAAVRVAAYYDEDLSRDLAKMLPFALLGVYLVNISFFNFSESLELLKQIPSMWNSLVYYLLFVIALEFLMRILSLFRTKESTE